MTRSRYDAIVVGSRVAGAATAMLLARAGLDVLVLDRARYGTDTLSTHALMRGGVLQLRRWGLLHDIVAAGTPPVRRTVIRYGDAEEVVDIRPRSGSDALYAPRRWLLDRVVTDAAARDGADVRFATAVTDVTRDPTGRVTGVVASSRHGGRRRVHAPIVIGADGARSVVARSVAAPVTAVGRHGSAMLVTWYSGVGADGYQWLYGQTADGSPRSAGVIPTNRGQVCAWAALPRERFRDRRPQQHFREVFEAIAPDWAARLRDGRRHGPVAGFPGLAGYLRRPWGPGWALVGDAGYFKDPLSTHGITDALRDAELLARAVVAGAHDPRVTADALAAYEQTRDALSLPLFRVADTVASYAWSIDELRELLLAMSTAMRQEVTHLAALDTGDTARAPLAA